MMTQSKSANHAHYAGKLERSSSRSSLADRQLIIMGNARMAFAPDVGSCLLMGGEGSGFTSVRSVITRCMVSSPVGGMRFHLRNGLSRERRRHRLAIDIEDRVFQYTRYLEPLVVPFVPPQSAPSQYRLTRMAAVAGQDLLLFQKMVSRKPFAPGSCLRLGKLYARTVSIRTASPCLLEQ